MQRIFRLLTCFPVVLSLLLLLLLPERIPAHYNLYGEVDRWGSRLEVLLLPLCCLVIGLIWKRFIQKMSLTQPQNQKPMLIAGCSLLAALDALSCVFLFFSFSAADVPQIGILLPQLLYTLLGLSLLPLGAAMPKGQTQRCPGSAHQMEHGKRPLLGALPARRRKKPAADRCTAHCRQPADSQPIVAQSPAYCSAHIGRNFLHPLFLSNPEKIWQLKFFFFITFLHKRAILRSN